MENLQEIVGEKGLYKIEKAKIMYKIEVYEKFMIKQNLDTREYNAKFYKEGK